MRYKDNIFWEILVVVFGFFCISKELSYLCGSIKQLIMSDILVCPACGGENGYFDGSLNNCADCGHEWSEDFLIEESAKTPRDSNGTELVDGDSVTVIKDLKVKGSSMVIKRGTKVKSIKLTDNPEEVDCRIEGSGIVLKTCFLKK